MLHDAENKMDKPGYIIQVLFNFFFLPNAWHLMRYGILCWFQFSDLENEDGTNNFVSILSVSTLSKSRAQSL